MKLFFILGNQLFPPKYLDRFKNDHLFFMSEDYELCTYEKHHKLKILLFLSAMRSHADHLKKNKFKVEYTKIDSADFKKDYLEKVKRELSENNILVEDVKETIQVSDFKDKILKLSCGKKKHYLVKII